MPPGPGRRRQLVDQRRQPADFRGVDREPGGGDDRRHLDHELDHVDDQHTPQPGVRGKGHVEHADAEQRLPALQAEQHSRDLAGREIDRRHDHAVEEEAEIDGPEAAHRARGPARIADLVELEVRHDSGPPPQPGIEEDRRHAGQHERPPHPVPGHAVAADDVGDEIGSVAAEGRGDHGEPGQPPWHGAAGHEELRRAPAGALPEEQRRNEADQQGQGDDEPVEGLQLHRFSV